MISSKNKEKEHENQEKIHNNLKKNSEFDEKNLHISQEFLDKKLAKLEKIQKKLQKIEKIEKRDENIKKIEPTISNQQIISKYYSKAIQSETFSKKLSKFQLKNNKNIDFDVVFPLKSNENPPKNLSNLFGE